MFVRLARFALAVTVVSTLFACTDPAPITTGDRTSSEDKDGDEGSGTASGSKTADDAGTTTAKTPADGGGKSADPAKPADPDCVAACNGSDLKTRCDFGGDEATFCEDTCGFMSKAEIECLIGKSTCTKSDVVACQQSGGSK